MRTLFPMLIFTFLGISLSSAQTKVFDVNGSKIGIQNDRIQLEMVPSEVEIPQQVRVVDGSGQQEMGAFALTSINTALDVLPTIATKLLEKRAQSFTGEYLARNSYLECGSSTVPHLTVTRTVRINGEEKTAFRLILKAHAFPNYPDAFFYYIEAADLEYAKARTKGKQQLFDYTIEIQPTFIVNGEKKTQAINPLIIKSVGFGDQGFNDEGELLYRTDLIPLPQESQLADVTVKITESNPSKVKVERLLETIETYQDSVKTVINNFLPSEPSGEEDDNDGGNGDGGNEVDNS